MLALSCSASSLPALPTQAAVALWRHHQPASIPDEAREIPAPGVARDLERMFGVMPRYFEHPERASPATFGVFGATVVLPSNFSSLDGARQRAIVCHELLHVKRRDALIAAIEEIVATLLWFHPWVWLLRLRIRVAREQVVNRRVIELIGHREA